MKRTTGAAPVRPGPGFWFALGLAAVSLGCASGPRDPALEALLAVRAGGPLLEPRPGLDVERAYGLQARLLQRLQSAGDRLTGYKIAFSSEAAQREWGIEGPASGPLLASMRVAAGRPVAAGEFRAPRIELEVGFVIDTLVEPPLTVERLQGAVRSAHVALELADIRFAPGRRPSAADVIADAAGAHRFALGPPHTPEAVHPGTACELRVGGEVFGRAAAREALGDPWNALAWLAGALAARGERLEPGQIVLTGALGPVWAPPSVGLATAVEGRCAGLGRIEVELR